MVSQFNQNNLELKRKDKKILFSIFCHLFKPWGTILPIPWNPSLLPYTTKLTANVKTPEWGTFWIFITKLYRDCWLVSVSAEKRKMWEMCWTLFSIKIVFFCPTRRWNLEAIRTRHQTFPKQTCIVKIKYVSATTTSTSIISTYLHFLKWRIFCIYFVNFSIDT